MVFSKFFHRRLQKDLDQDKENRLDPDQHQDQNLYLDNHKDPLLDPDQALDQNQDPDQDQDTGSAVFCIRFIDDSKIQTKT